MKTAIITFMNRPIIGIEMDVATDDHDVTRCMLRMNYLQRIIDAGGLPLPIPPLPHLVTTYLHQCDGVILTGGDDPRTEPFGQPTHPKARVIHPQRQDTIIALLDALRNRPDIPVLGICLGMQMMCLHAGGQLEQYLPDVLPTAANHQGCKPHPILLNHHDSTLASLADVTGNHHAEEKDQSVLQVISAHQQAVRDAGALRVTAQAADGVIEAVDDPARPFYTGVQWHPERGDDGALSFGLLRQFVQACRRGSSGPPAGSPPPQVRRRPC